MDERRKHDRYKITGRALLSLGQPPGSAQVRLIDIGLTGLSFLAEVPLPTGASARLDLSVLGQHEFIAAHPAITVRYCVLERRMYRIGADFVGLDEAASAAIAAIVEARAHR